MRDLIILHLNGHELWFRIHFIYDFILEEEYIDDADLLLEFANGVPTFTNGAPKWLVGMMNKELYSDIMEQLYGEDLTTESM